MFDAATESVMAGAPVLTGLGGSAYSSYISRSFAEIFAEKIRLRGEVLSSPEIRAATLRLRRLGSAMEALVASSTDRSNRTGAAFVGATAHHVASTGVPSGAAAHVSSLSSHAITSDVAAVLLYLTAGSPADAAEAARRLVIPASHGIERELLRAIRCIALGRLDEVLSLQVPLRDLSEDLDDDRATDELYRRILLVVQENARAMHPTERRGSAQDGEALDLQLETIRQLCTDSWPSLFQGAEAVLSVFAGPLHLTSLLGPALRFLRDCSLVNMRRPEGIEQEVWDFVIEHVAARRPYLWPNHIDAITEGFLRQGTCSAVSFPTGAGKSTLSELKIAATLATGRKVVFLAPTLALVDQTSTALKKSFEGVSGETSETLGIPNELQGFENITVMTPEKFLAVITFSPDAFVDTGLLIFDECHLIHPRGPDLNNRAIDSMLAILNFTYKMPEADLLLLSAMMANTSEIASWMQELTGRPCLALTTKWKPTRQMRGCVVYSREEVEVLQRDLQAERRVSPLVNPPKKLKERLEVSPQAVFGLDNQWVSRDLQDYALLPLLGSKVKLATGTRTRGDNAWYLTPNANQVAAAIASASGEKEIKTLVFGENVKFVTSIANVVSEALPRSPILMKPAETRLFESALEDIGSIDAMYVAVDGTHTNVTRSCLPHHSLLLPAERRLHEALYARTDGIHVLAATSTLAQGMNLPGSVVVIAGDSRYNTVTATRENLAAHELLNAAGRAGRAGDNSYGMVLLIPGQIITSEPTDLPVSNSWQRISSVFGQDDQCLILNDPLEGILDKILAHEPNADTDYLLRRLLPIGEEDEDAIDLVVNRSLAAFQARRRGEQTWPESVNEAVRTQSAEHPGVSRDLQWLAAGAGVPVWAMAALGHELERNPPREDVTVEGATQWVIETLVRQPSLLPALSRHQSDVLGTFQPDDAPESVEILAPNAMLQWNLLRMWMEGATLTSMEKMVSDTTKKRADTHCMKARAFVLRSARELAFVFGLPGKIMALTQSAGDQQQVPLAWEELGRCVKDGFDRPEKLALWLATGQRESRRWCHDKVDLDIEGKFSPAAGESLSQLVSRFRNSLTSPS